MRPTGRADQCPQLGGNRTQRGRRLWAVHDPNSVIAVMSAARPLFRRKPKSIRDLATLQKVPTADLDAVLPRIETSSVALPESRSGTCRSPSLAQRRCRRQASHSGLQIRGLPVFTSRLRVRSRARESSGPGDWNAMKLPRRNFLHLAAGAAALPSVSRFAWAQAYPSRPITMVVGYGVGGPSDTIARIVAERMKFTLGQPIVVENVTGAAGSIGVGRLARAVSDGYTIGLGDWSTLCVNA